MGILKLLIVTILLLLPFGEFLRFNLANNIVVRPLDIIVGVTAVYWGIITIIQKKKIDKYYLLPIVTFAGLGLFSLVLNYSWLKESAFLVSLLYLIRWVSYAVILFVVSAFDNKFKEKIVGFLIFDGALLVLLGYLQFLFFSDLKGLYYLGWDDHMYRMFSTFFDPNFAGAFFVFYFLLLCCTYYRFNKQSNKRLLLLILCVFTFFAIVLTFSRSALVMLIVGVGAFLFLINKKRLFLLLIAGLIVIFVFISPRFYVENVNIFRPASVNARLQNYTTAFKIITDRPVFGVGFNSYRYTKKLYNLPHEWIKAPSHADAGVDNSWLFIFATTGLVGFGAYIFLWSRIVRQAFVLQQLRNDMFPALVISSATALFVDALFINSLFFPHLMLWMWVLIGIMEKK